MRDVRADKLGAALDRDGAVLVDERAGLVRVALDADGVGGGEVREPRLLHQIEVKMKVVNAEQPQPEDLFRFNQMPDVGA